ncbi:MAG TPA: ABC transporter ATP-binding protein [Thermoleophilaceae bacterium]
MLEVAELRVAYGAVMALRGVSMRVLEGEIVAVIGANGAGKSTLLWSISGVVKPVGGSIHFRGDRIDGQRPEAIARKGLSLVPEGRHIFGALTVRENLELGARARGRLNRGEQEDLVGLAVSRFPFLERRLQSPAGQLSGGEQQQLAIARALVARPKFMLLDEPSFGLAPLIVERVMQELAQLRDDGITVLLIEQVAGIAVELADRTYVLRNGEVELTGTREELLERADFAAAYLGESYV